MDEERGGISYQNTYADIRARYPAVELPSSAIMLLAQLRAYHSPTYIHSLGCAALAAEIAAVMGLDVAQVRLAAVLHDIGKIRVPVRVLNKPGSFNQREWDIIRRHPGDGQSIVLTFPELAGLAPIINAHHERPDGLGYPVKLMGDAIPLEARVVAVADAIDAMRMDRPQRPRRSEAFIQAELQRGAGTVWDTAVVNACIDRINTQYSGQVGDNEPSECVIRNR